MSPYEEVKAEFKKNLTHPMTPAAERLFDEIFQMTVEHALATTRWEGAGRVWVLKQVGKIARKAQSETPGRRITRKALAKAANRQIPLASKACRFGQTMDKDQEPAKEEFGIYCVVFAAVV